MFHYYALKFLALRAGFSQDDAEVLAMSSQLVDRAIVPLKVEMPGSSYKVATTHHFGFWDQTQEADVWIPFHFFPSAATGSTQNSKSKESGVHSTTPISMRKDGKIDPMEVRPNSAPVKELLLSALKSRNLYRVGIALHTYADSWAHQNFTGKNTGFNRLENFSPVPPAGHAQAGRNPDIWSRQWLDPRLRDEDAVIDNHQRFMAAAERSYRYLATYNRRGFDDWPFIEAELEILMLDDKPDAKASFPRKNRVKEDHQMELEWIIALETERLAPRKWFTELRPGDESEREISRISESEAFRFARHEIARLLPLRDLEPVKATEGFLQSHLYQWSEAANEQRRVAKEILSQI